MEKGLKVEEVDKKTLSTKDNGYSVEKAALELNLGEALKEQSKDQLIVSENKVTFRYPANWDYYQTPDKIIIGDTSYQIDSKDIKQYKNIYEVSINNNDLIYTMRKFGGDYLNVK